MPDSSISISTLKWDEIKQKLNDLNTQLSSPDLQNNKRSALQKKSSYFSKLLEKHDKIEVLEKEYSDIKSLLTDEKDSELRDLYDQELEALSSDIKKEYGDLDNLIFPPSELDTRSAFLEIRAGTGGQEASLFAADLLKMYTNYALKSNWKVAIIDSSQTDLGGYREIILHIQGKNVYGKLKQESGVHRVQRVPATETSGRIHTSTATVAILPEAEEVDVSISPADLRIDVYRSSGAGGQHVNTTDSAVRITHIPTGVVVTCQDERSQLKNKNKAMKMLKSRLLVAHEEKQQSELSQKRKELVGTGMRSEKVRTYNFPQNRITDHQVELTLKKLEIVLEGNLDEIIEALVEKERIERRKNPLPFLES